MESAKMTPPKMPEKLDVLDMGQHGEYVGTHQDNATGCYLVTTTNPWINHEQRAAFAAEIVRRWNAYEAMLAAVNAGKAYTDGLAAAWCDDGSVRQSANGVTTVRGEKIDLDALFDEWMRLIGYALPRDLVVTEAARQAAREALAAEPGKDAPCPPQP